MHYIFVLNTLLIYEFLSGMGLKTALEKFSDMESFDDIIDPKDVHFFSKANTTQENLYLYHETIKEIFELCSGEPLLS